MSQYDPNVNQALVNARLAARAAEASRSRLAAGRARRERTRRGRGIARGVTTIHHQPRAGEPAREEGQLTLIR
jgi:hypothetical protein